MISPELIRRYPFFAELSFDQINILAKAADEMTVDAGHYFHREGDTLNKFYIVEEGEVAVVISVPDRNVEHKFVDQLNHTLITEDIQVSSVVVGEMFGWSALVPPHKSTAGVKAISPCRVLSFDCEKIRPYFEDDYRFAYLMTLKAAQAVRERLRSRRIESLAFLPV